MLYCILTGNVLKLQVGCVTKHLKCFCHICVFDERRIMCFKLQLGFLIMLLFSLGLNTLPTAVWIHVYIHRLCIKYVWIVFEHIWICVRHTLTHTWVYIETDRQKERETLFLGKLQIWVFTGYSRNTDDVGGGFLEGFFVFFFFWGWGREKVEQMDFW